MSKDVVQHMGLFIELRKRLIYFFIVLLSIFAILLYFSNPLYTYLAKPLLKFLPQGHLISTQLVAPFFVPFKLSLMVSFLVAMPYLFYQLWRFISPALYGYERRMLWPFLVSSLFLFYAGMCFAYFVIFPMLFHFLTGVVPSGVVLSPDITEYFDFTIKLLLIFGALFEIPIVMVLLVAMNIITRAGFIRCRSYAIVSAFVIAMLLAPPDVLSQTILAIPIWLLYEMGIVLTRFVSVEPNGEVAKKD